MEIFPVLELAELLQLVTLDKNIAGTSCENIEAKINPLIIAYINEKEEEDEAVTIGVNEKMKTKYIPQSSNDKKRTDNGSKET